MKIIPFVFALLVGTLMLSRPAHAAAGATSVHAILVIASNEKGGSDPKLAPYEPTLRRVLRFESYRAVGEGSASVSGGGTASISLASGNRVDLQSDAGGGVKVMRGGQAIPLSPGKPVVVLGGAAGGKGDAYAIIVTAN